MSRPIPSRRDFLRQAMVSAAAALPFVLRQDRLLARTQGMHLSTDETVIRKRLAAGIDENLVRLPVGDLVAAMGRSFLGSPYEANTLEESGDEHLVVNLREFDCVTLCETSLALARTIKLHSDSIQGYCQQLQLIRYRSGTIKGYASRLHYFSEWISDNEKKNVLRDMTQELGGRRDGRELNFMSSHREAYSRIVSDDAFAAIVAMEKELSTHPRYLLPKESVEGVLGKIQNGDIIAITTSVPGLDVSHTGIAVKEGGTTRLLHAPSVGQQVQITRGSIADYVHAHDKQSGVMIARPHDPGI